MNDKATFYSPVLSDSSPCIILFDTINGFFTWYYDSLAEVNNSVGRRPTAPMPAKRIPELKRVFESQFRNAIDKVLSLHIGASTNDVIFAIDCLRHRVWRNAFLCDTKQPNRPVYKAHRKRFRDPGITLLMRFLFDDLIPHVFPGRRVGASNAEADDVIAVITRMVNARAPKRRVIIVSDDSDFIQLLDYPNNDIYTQRFLRVRNRIFRSPREITHIKIISGDKADNISAAFPRCGVKRAQTLVSRPYLFNRYIKKYGRKLYDRNKLLIDFDFIPARIKGLIIERALCLRFESRMCN